MIKKILIFTILSCSLINISCSNNKITDTNIQNINSSLEIQDFVSHIYQLNFKYPKNLTINESFKDLKSIPENTIIIKNDSKNKFEDLENDFITKVKETYSIEPQIKSYKIKHNDNNVLVKLINTYNSKISIIVGKYPSSYKYSLTLPEVKSFILITPKKYSEKIIEEINFKMSPYQYLIGAMNIIKENSIFKSQTNWDKWKKEILDNFEKTKDIKSSIKLGFKNIGDNHSTYWNKEYADSIVKGNDKSTGIDFLPYKDGKYVIFEVFPESPAHKLGIKVGDIILSKINNNDGSVYLKLKRELENKEWEITIIPDYFDTNIEPTVKLINSNIAYIELTGSTGTYAYQKYPNIVHNKIKTLTEKNKIDGWIIDLRKNTGGATWPMLNSIGYLLGNGNIGGRLDNLGYTNLWKYLNGKFFLGDQLVSELKTEYFKVKEENQPVIVLISNTTSSAGEGVAIAFKGRENTYFIGENSDGRTTGTNTFILNDGSWLNIANTVNIDRNGEKYFNPIKPDLLDIVDWKYFGDDKKDSNIINALTWFKEVKKL